MKERVNSPEFGVERPSHDQQPGQDVDEDAPHPRRHCVRLRRAKVDVQHDYRHADAGQRKKEEGGHSLLDFSS